jgi:hypothetical protein
MYGSDPKTTPHFTACQKYGMLVLRPVDSELMKYFRLLQTYKMDGAAIVSHDKVTPNNLHHLNASFIVNSNMSKTLLIFCDGTGMDGNLSVHSKEMVFCLSHHLTG